MVDGEVLDGGVAEPTAEVARPDWLPEKFKAPEDMVKSYNSLEQRMGSAPKEYDMSKSESWLDPSYEGFSDMMALAKEKGVSQEVMDSMLEKTGEYIHSFSGSMEKEREKLGEKADERIEVINNWAKANLSEDSFYALTESMNTAAAVTALEELRSKVLDNNTQVPNGNISPEASKDSLEDIQSEMNSNIERYKTDRAYRSEILAKMERLQHGGYIDKSSA